MDKNKNILSRTSVAFIERRPNFWLRYGSFLVLVALLLLLWVNMNKDGNEELSSPLIYQPAETEEQTFHLSEDASINRLFVQSNDVVKVGDTLFAIADPALLEKLKITDSLLSDGTISIDRKINAFKNIPNEKWPATLSVEVESIYEAFTATRSKGMNKATKEMVTEMEAEVLNSLKESEGLRKSIPKFEAMRDNAQEAFNSAKTQYSQGTIELSELQSLKKKLDETVDFVKIRESDLAEHQRLIYNFNRQIDSARRKSGKQILNYPLIQKRLESLQSQIKDWLESAYFVAKEEGVVKELISLGPAKKGDLIFKLSNENDSKVSPAKLMANFTKEQAGNIQIGQSVILRISSDTFDKEISATVEEVGNVDDAFQVTLKPAVEFDFENTLITKGDVIISNPQESFLSKVLANFT